MKDSILQDLISLYGPVGQEDEVREYCIEHLKQYDIDTKVDKAGNVIATLPGKTDQSVTLLAHMDEIAMIVKKVNKDGTLQIKQLGALDAFNIGQGPVDILGSNDVVTGILSLGCMHSTKATHNVWEVKPSGGNKSLTFEHMHVFTGKSKQEIDKAGIRAGTRVVVPKSKRQIIELGDYIGAPYMDDRAPMAVLLLLLFQLKQNNGIPEKTIHIVFTTSEELGAIGANYVASQHSTDFIAVDIAPVEDEYGVELSASPIFMYQDAFATYDKKLTDTLFQISQDLNHSPQTMVTEVYGSDASIPKRMGHIGRGAAITIPTKNSHGFEIIHKHAIRKIVDVLERYVAS